MLWCCCNIYYLKVCIKIVFSILNIVLFFRASAIRSRGGGCYFIIDFVYDV